MIQLSLFDSENQIPTPCVYSLHAKEITADEVYEFRQRIIKSFPVHPVGKFNGIQMRRFKEAMKDDRINDARALVMEAKFDG